MASSLTIPVWVLVLVWSAGGYAVALRLQAAILTANLGRKLRRLPLVPRYSLVALAVVLTGPWVWWTVLREVAKELGVWARTRLARWWTNRKEANSDG